MNVTPIRNSSPSMMDEIVNLTFCAHDYLEHRLLYSHTRRGWYVSSVNDRHSAPRKTYPNVISGLSALERVSGRRCDDFTALGS